MSKVLKESTDINRKKITRVLLALLVMLMIGSGSVNAAGAGSDHKKVGLNKDKVTLKIGKTTTIKRRGKGKVEWSCSNKKTVKIISRTSKSVKIKGIKNGSAIMKARIGKKTYRCQIRVKGAGTGQSSKGLGRIPYGNIKGWRIDKGKKKPEIKKGSTEDKVSISCTYSWEPVTEVNKKYKEKIYASGKSYDLIRQQGLSKKIIRAPRGGLGYGSQTVFYHYKPSDGMYPVTDTITLTIDNKSSKALHFQDTMYTAAVPVSRSGGAISASDVFYYGAKSRFISEAGAFDVAAGEKKTVKYRHSERSSTNSSDPHAPALSTFSIPAKSCMNYYFDSYSSFVFFKAGSKEYAYLYGHLGHKIQDEHNFFVDYVAFTGPAGAIFNPSWDKKLYKRLKANQKYQDAHGEVVRISYPNWINEPKDEYIRP